MTRHVYLDPMPTALSHAEIVALKDITRMVLTATQKEQLAVMAYSESGEYVLEYRLALDEPAVACFRVPDGPRGLQRLRDALRSS